MATVVQKQGRRVYRSQHTIRVPLLLWKRREREKKRHKNKHMHSTENTGWLIDNYQKSMTVSQCKNNNALHIPYTIQNLFFFISYVKVLCKDRKCFAIMWLEAEFKNNLLCICKSYQLKCDENVFLSGRTVLVRFFCCFWHKTYTRQVFDQNTTQRMYNRMDDTRIKTTLNGTKQTMSILWHLLWAEQKKITVFCSTSFHCGDSDREWE